MKTTPPADDARQPAETIIMCLPNLKSKSLQAFPIPGAKTTRYVSQPLDGLQAFDQAIDIGFVRIGVGADAQSAVAAVDGHVVPQ